MRFRSALIDDEVREDRYIVLTDPPYITRYRSRDGRTVPNGGGLSDTS